MRLIAIIMSVVLSSCSSISVSSEQSPTRTDILYKYAHSSCIFWYLSSKGHDTKDIRAISGGIVETSNISIDVFTEISLFVKDYLPKVQTKNDIDMNLYRCFYLEESEQLKRILHK